MEAEMKRRGSPVHFSLSMERPPRMYRVPFGGGAVRCVTARTPLEGEMGRGGLRGMSMGSGGQRWTGARTVCFRGARGRKDGDKPRVDEHPPAGGHRWSCGCCLPRLRNARSRGVWTKLE